MLRRASISTWSRSAHPQYSTITDCLCSHVATPPLPAVSLSLSVRVCVVSSFQWQSTALQYVAAVYCTHRQSTGKLPPEVPCWARSSGPQVAVAISRSVRLNASRRTLTHTRHTIDPLRGAHSRCLSLASNYCITADLPMLLSLRVEFSGPRRLRLAALLLIFSSHVCIRGRSYV